MLSLWAEAAAEFPFTMFESVPVIGLLWKGANATRKHLWLAQHLHSIERQLAALACAQSSSRVPCRQFLPWPMSENAEHGFNDTGVKKSSAGEQIDLSLLSQREHDKHRRLFALETHMKFIGHCSLTDEQQNWVLDQMQALYRQGVLEKFDPRASRSYGLDLLTEIHYLCERRPPCLEGIVRLFSRFYLGCYRYGADVKRTANDVC